MGLDHYTINHTKKYRMVDDKNGVIINCSSVYIECSF